MPESNPLDRALDRVEKGCPARLARAIRWLRVPHRRWVRLPAGVAFTLGGLFWFLPVVGIEMLPVGLALIAIDVPLLQRPVGRSILWLDERWTRLRVWRMERRHQR